MKKTISILIVLALIVLVFGTGFFIEKSFIIVPLDFVKKVLKYDLYEKSLVLEQENADLKAQLQKNQIFNSQELNEGAGFIRARIFSQYPFNFKNIISIDKGTKDGIKIGQAAVLAENILAGQVSEVFENAASVRTVFDPSWQLPVKIGEEKINGLFKGGNDPQIILIEKPIKINDPVFAASKDLPLDLKIGEIKEIKEPSKGALSEASVKIPYSLGEIDSIFIHN